MPSFRPDQSVAALRADLGGANEQSYITPSNIDGAYEVQRIVHPAVAAMAQGDFYKLTNYAGTKFAVWFDIDADGTEPNGAIYSACDVKIKVSVSTGDLAPAVATAAKTAIDLEVLFVGFSIVKTSATLDFTSTIKGNLAAPASYVEAETAGPFTASTPTGGSEPTVGGKYFTFSNTTTSFYAWFTNNGVGADPAVADHTSKVIALTGNETNAQYLAAIVSVLDSTSGMTAVLDGSRIVLHVDGVGPATDLTAGDSGFTVAVAAQGATAYYGPNDGRADDSPVPVAFS